MNGMVELGYKGYPYWARDVRYWLRSRADMFVYASSEDLDEMLAEANESCGVWDREAKDWVAS